MSGIRWNMEIFIFHSIQLEYILPRFSQWWDWSQMHRWGSRIHSQNQFFKCHRTKRPRNIHFLRHILQKLMKFMTFEQVDWHGFYRNLITIFQLFKVRKYRCRESKLSEDCLRSKHLKRKFFESWWPFSERWHRRLDIGNILGLKIKMNSRL
jgi:hypothetical protein